MFKNYNNSKRASLLSVGLILSIWIALMGCGSYFLLLYDNKPGLPGNPPPIWPVSVDRESNVFTAVMFVHPQCSCSRASIGELSKLMASYASLLRSKVIFLDADSDLSENGSWLAASAIPGVMSIRDIDSKFAKIFRVQTSGHILLYNQEGRLVFSGGITASRGHWGDNTGSQAIGEILEKKVAVVNHTAIFGCNLFTQEKAS